MLQILFMVIHAVAGFFTMVLLARTVMRWQRMSFVNPFGQFILATTNWLVVPAQRVLPGVGRLDLASALPALLIQVLLVWLDATVMPYALDRPGSVLAGVFAIGLLKLLQVALHLLLGAIIINVILSWVNPHSPLAPTLNRFLDPFLTPFRRVIPPAGPVDLSPMVLSLLVWIAIRIVDQVIQRFTPLLFA